MKKAVLFIAVVSAFSFVSCKKDYICSCTTTSTIPGSTAQTTEMTAVDARKSDVKKRCIDSKQDYTVGGTTYTSTTTCEIK